MKKFLKKYWLAIVLILFAIGIAYLAFFRGEEPEPAPTPPPVAFEVERVYPQEGSHEVVIPNLAIEFVFTKKVDLSSFAVSISPSEDIGISYGDTEKSVVVRPADEWQMDVTYQFEVRAESKEGESLNSPYEYKIEFTELQQSDLEEG